MTEQELNKKLAEWAGFELKRVQCVGLVYYETEQDCWYYNGREYGLRLPDWLNSLDACFKWLVPKLPAPDYIKFRIRKKGYMCEVRGFGLQVNAYYYESPALALCLAIEKLIDGVSNEDT